MRPRYAVNDLPEGSINTDRILYPCPTGTASFSSNLPFERGK